jgi:hypothetical protein
MPKQLDPRLVDILKAYHPDPRSAVWDCHGVWVIYHKAVEIIAAKAGITFDEPHETEMNAKEKIAVIRVTGHLGDRTEWSYGEAAPYNNKNGYPISMAEKRAKDRVVLKLLNLHGEIYSKEEIDEDELKKEAERRAARGKPEQDQQPVLEEAPKETPTLAEQQVFVPALLSDISLIQNTGDLAAWAAKHAEQISQLSEVDQKIVRDAYKTHRTSLTEAA